ncbi:benzaldehyde dehydrogenase II [Streptomyces malaysiensis subsp. malaysiensis]|nr:benzaldehyde dehydrogenase II [Streptomyces malaysiensis]
MERAFTAARAAQREWAELSPRQRARPFARFHDVLLARQTPGVLRTRRRQGAVFTASLRALKALRIR